VRVDLSNTALQLTPNFAFSPLRVAEFECFSLAMKTANTPGDSVSAPYYSHTLLDAAVANETPDDLDQRIPLSPPLSK
jgi:hypothetical protein